MLSPPRPTGVFQKNEHKEIVSGGTWKVTILIHSGVHPAIGLGETLLGQAPAIFAKQH